MSCLYLSRQSIPSHVPLSPFFISHLYKDLNPNLQISPTLRAQRVSEPKLPRSPPPPIPRRSHRRHPVQALRSLCQQVQPPFPFFLSLFFCPPLRPIPPSKRFNMIPPTLVSVDDLGRIIIAGMAPIHSWARGRSSQMASAETTSLTHTRR
jgi:hypothetical protein